MEFLSAGDFKSTLNEATSAVVVMHGTEKISFQTGEAEAVKNAIKFSASLLGMPANAPVPTVIKFSPFSVRFKEDGTAFLARETGGVSFSKANWEDLITLINMSVNRVADYLKIRGGPRAGVSSVRMPDPII